MLVRSSLKILLSLVTLLVLPMLPDWSGLAHADRTKGLETVRGRGCQSYGDRETPDMARRGAVIKAQEEAIRRHGVFVRSYKRVKNLQLEEDIIEAFSAGELNEIRIGKEEHKARTICLTVTAKLSPVSMEDIIRQRVNATDITLEARSILVPPEPKFGLKVWTNKVDGRFFENDNLIVYVQSERDTYLKLDYFQADGTVVHLVPNMYHDQVFIEGGKIYSFGDEASPEHFVVSAPYGPEIVKAIATAQLFDSGADEGESRGNSRDYLQRLGGIKVVEAQASVEIRTDSLAVSEYRKKKAGLMR